MTTKKKATERLNAAINNMMGPRDFTKRNVARLLRACESWLDVADMKRCGHGPREDCECCREEAR